MTWPYSKSYHAPYTKPFMALYGDALGGGGWVTPADIPAAEAAALKVLYDDGGGPDWINNTGWGTGNAADYYGITVTAGHVTSIAIASNGGAGDLSNFNINAFQELTFFQIAGQDFFGDWSNIVLPPKLVRLYMMYNDFAFDFSTISIPDTLVYLQAYVNQLNGDLSAITLPAGVTFINVENNKLTGGYDLSQSVALAEYKIGRCLMDAPAIDTIYSGIYARRAAFTTAAPVVNTAITNAAPTGTYQDSATPSTGLEYIYKLVNDPDGEGFPRWTVTATGGTYTPP